MASLATVPIQRRKKPANVYGRASRHTFDVNSFFEEDEPVREPAAKRIKSANAALPQRQYVAEPKKHATVTVRADTAAVRTEKKSKAPIADAFDVPLSDEEDKQAPNQTLAPLKLRMQSRLVKDNVDSAQPSRAVASVSPGVETGTNSRLTRTDSGRLGVNSMVKGSSHVRHRTGASDSSPKATQDVIPATGSASERLAAKKRAAQSKEAPKSDADTQSTKAPIAPAATVRAAQGIRNTRKRTTSPVSGKRGEKGESLVLTCHPRQRQHLAAAVEPDIFDVPMDDHAPSAPKTSTVLKPSSRLRSRVSPMRMAQATPQKSLSAPEALTAMLPPSDELPEDSDDVDMDDVDQGHVSLSTARTGHTTPRQKLRRNSASDSGTLTPKQTQLWTDFFQANDTQPAATPATSMRKLKLGDKPQKSTEPAAVARRRTRAVDRLKASQISSSDSDSDDSSCSGTDGDDIIMPDVGSSVGLTGASNTTTSARFVPPPPSQVLPLQSQDGKGEGGPRITYAKTRSHLAEDSLEGMILDLPTETPQRPAATARRVDAAAAGVQALGFELDDGDDGSAKGVRTIHELRAAGRSTRVMGEISDLLGEISDHNVVARSRRRAALLELATKLIDPIFAKQFVGHGFEHQLLAEHEASPDPIADFVLASACTLLTAIDLSSHTLNSFQAVLHWLANLLPRNSSIISVAKERTSNMSRAAQTELTEFAEKLKCSPHFKEAQPLLITPRLIALKGIDALVGKLRNLGNKSRLFTDQALIALLPAAGLGAATSRGGDDAFQAEVTISILEALSTLLTVSDWPRQVVSSIASLPKALAEAQETREHTKWLSYRLCLNATNDHAIDQSIFGSHDVVHPVLNDIVAGFEGLQQPGRIEEEDEGTSLRRLDILVLATGILTNLAEYSPSARLQVAEPSKLPALAQVIKIFRTGQDKLEDAESEQESVANVALGYLAVMLANLCQEESVKNVIAGLLPGGDLKTLVHAIEEFMLYHRKVDELAFEGAEGQEVWSVFTGRLQDVLVRLKATDV